MISEDPGSNTYPTSEFLHYQRPSLLFNAHFETIYPSLFRKVVLDAPTEHTLELSDGDFLEYDMYEDKRARGRHLCILCHGMEGNSRRPYILGMVRAVQEAGFDAVAWNYRGCGSKMNRLDRFYHCGATDDLEAIIAHTARDYTTVHLIGFSLGGNLILKYLGENPERSLKITSAFTVSVPANMHSACRKLSSLSNLIYSRNFVSSMVRKVREKALTNPALRRFNAKAIDNVLAFDEHITAPLNGYADAADYYSANSAIRFMDDIRRPVVILNAANDPFFTPDCSPAEQFNRHPYVRFQMTAHGGHVGFYDNDSKGRYFSEQLAVAHLEKFSR